MKAVNYYLIIDMIKEEPKKVGGLILTEETDVDNRYLKAKVVSTGNLVEGIKEGDTIYYDKHAGHGIQHKNKFYGVIKQQDVVLIDQPKPESTNLKLENKNKLLIIKNKKNEQRINKRCLFVLLQ